MGKRELVKVEGLAELAKALRELPDRVAKNGLRVSVYAGAKVIRDEARLRAPKATESLGPNQPPPGTLKRSVIMKQIPELSSLTRQTFFVTVRHGKKYRKQGKKGNLSQDAWYWRFVEFGTPKMRARPFLRPALEAKRREAVQAMKDRLSERIELEAKNLYRGQQRK
jgi:HK97 gp10 family phage protein